MLCLYDAAPAKNEALDEARFFFGERLLSCARLLHNGSLPAAIGLRSYWILAGWKACGVTVTSRVP
ncbi:hypothetical protein ACE3MS_07130 [Paenibacillus dendritiformis]|uniref:hypothetical protein n=1 Tax=Paenibacillus dendritiformis TaxID=130049 RepID=UPI00365F3C44